MGSATVIKTLLQRRYYMLWFLFYQIFHILQTKTRTENTN